MNLSELINEILSEWAYRVENGMPDPKNPIHIKELGIVLSEMGLSHIKNDLVENLLMEKGKTPEKNVVEAEKGNFTNPALNKSIKYRNDKGEDAEGIVGNLLRLPKEHPGRVAAEKTLPQDGTPERDSINKDLGGEGQPKKPEDGKGEKGGEEGGAPKEDPIKKAAPMFDPKVDPAMAARMDKEKEVQSQLAKDAEADKEAEKAQEPKKDDEFQPIDSKDVAKEMPEADPETFSGGSDIPDGVKPEELEKFNTDIKKVAQQVADAKAKGEPAPNINLCDVTVPGTNLYCDDNLGIPRDEMPQFKGNASPGSRAAGMDADASGEVDTEPVFKEMLKEKGIKTLQTEIPADKLKATQKDLVGAKVVGMMAALEKDPQHPKITAPIYVSRDGHVIDGHHRWAAIVAHNAANPDNQIPMKTTVLDMDIKEAIPMANKFAEDMGIAAKKADANKETPSDQLVTKQPDEVVDGLKNRTTSNGEKLDVETTPNGSMIIGIEHGKGNESTKETINQVTSLPKDTKVMFVGEGGMSKDSEGNIQFSGEQKEIRDAVKGHFDNAEESSWDENADISDDTSPVFDEVANAVGGSKSKAKAAVWSNMYGQDGKDADMLPEDYLDDEGKAWLIDQAKKGGSSQFDGDVDWDNLTDAQQKDLYELNYNDEGKMADNEIMKAQEAYNGFRQRELDRKIKEAEDAGYTVIAPVGNSHVDAYRKGKSEKPTEKLPEPKAADETPGGKIYSIGGGYYSDTPGGPAQYRIVESIVEEVLLHGDETLAYLLFEAVVTKTTARGKKVKVQTIDPKKQKAATKAAKAATSKDTKDTGEETTQAVDLKKVDKIFKELYGKDGKGILLQGSATSDAALKNGYTEGEWWVAPGNAGSNFNENMSNEVAVILQKYPNLTEQELAMIIFTKVFGTKLGEQQSEPVIKSKNKIKIPEGITKEQQGLYKNCAIVARSGKSKYQRSTEGADECRKQVGFGKTASVIGYGGTSKKDNTPEKIKTDRDNMLSEVDTSKNCYIYDNETRKVYKIEKEDLKKWIMSSGGGENAADTVVLTKDINGNLLYDGWSDKKTLGDLQANGTLYNDMIQSGIRVEEMIKSGQISQADAGKARKIIEDGANEIKLIERGYSTISSNHSKYHLGLSPQEFKKMEEFVLTNPDTKKHYKNWVDTINKVISAQGKSDAKSVAIAEEISGVKRKKSKEELQADAFVQDTLDKYGEDNTAGLLKNPEIEDSVKQQVRKALDAGKKGRTEYINWFNQTWLGDKKNKQAIKSVSPFKILNNVQIKSPNVVTENERKVIDRGATSARETFKAAGKPIPKTIDTQGALEAMRKKAFETQRGIFEKLSKIKAKTMNGNPTNAAAALGFKDAVAALHLDKIDLPKNDKDIHQILKRSTDLTMEGIRVSAKTIKNCLGVDDTKDLEKNFVVDFKTEKFIKNKEGFVTGKSIAIYLVDKNNQRKEISPKVFRPKQGPQAKTANTLAWSDDMQKCFDSKNK